MPYDDRVVWVNVRLYLYILILRMYNSISGSLRCYRKVQAAVVLEVIGECR